MKDFMGENFLLSTDTAVELYHTYAKDMPIIDYHCHLSPKEIYENKRFKNITEAWLYGDHYKWRLMRANGISEECVTGNADDYDKFLAWAKTVPMTIGNPLYNWTHLELQRFFDVHELLNEKSAPVIWEKVNGLLQGENFGARDLIVKSNVNVICTTDDPIDSLEYHQLLQKDQDFNVSVYPSFRPDKGLAINLPGYLEWVNQLAKVSEQQIEDYDNFLKALESRVRFFHEVGGRVSDHALDVIVYEEGTKEEVAAIFANVLQGGEITKEEERKYRTYTLNFLGGLYAELGWTMQFHINALRNNNDRMFNVLGPDTGYDSMNDDGIAKPLVSILNAMEKENSLPKTILYSLNPNDNPIIASIINSFQDGKTPGKIQFGPAWWFNDSKEGMIDQMKALANVGLFTRFLGMLTDSRSFLSYTRHEYFRRILCQLLGEWVENGEVPNDMELLGSIVQGISYDNANTYFGFE
ncbi:glucuronate isomerase [Peribacillus psychrosaccharolyticus]|uniref:Uronate isomerase n=1 Tax=Peribacillus psychrosaccharolyticus TaxID=1407 RepID=A0A974S124_PERPY|nr:glucuronate isomerase [Peribacillus psychrosaccharolyticus]MEC2054453.1 glucuronate isomerase [Peribacillus psychrosaccharolyticus]MED3744320.1 glucuronate isomerase [Peribacillus psychrosaccharolyticus]QQS99799.1 glucuronate isomerase [Peribacillus psychrosaccharolyticus]